MDAFSEILIWMLGTLIFLSTILLILIHLVQNMQSSKALGIKPKLPRNRATCEIVTGETQYNNSLPLSEMASLPVKSIKNAMQMKVPNNFDSNMMEELIMNVVVRRVRK